MGQLAHSTQGLRPPPGCTWHRGAVVDAGVTAHILPSEPSPHFPSCWGCWLLMAGSWVPLQALSSAKEKHVIPQSDAWTNGLVIWNDKGLPPSLLQSRKFLEDHPASDLPMGLFTFFLCPIMLPSLPFRDIPGNTPQWHSWEQIFSLGVVPQGSWARNTVGADIHPGVWLHLEGRTRYSISHEYALLGLSYNLAQPLPTQLESWTSSGSQCLEGLGTGLGKEENLAAKWLRRLQRRVYLC